MNDTLNWKQELKQMKLESIKGSAPGFFEQSGGYQMKVSPYQDKTANGLTKCIIDWIDFKGGSANRINTQGQVRVEKVQLALGNYLEKVRFTPSMTNKGTADIHAIIKGRHVSIEVKIGKDRLSEHQLKEEQRVTGAGGLYYVARSMEEFTEWYKSRFEEAHSNT